MTWVKLDEWVVQEKERAEKEAEDPKHLKDGMNRREKIERSGYGKPERINTK